MNMMRKEADRFLNVYSKFNSNRVFKLHIKRIGREIRNRTAKNKSVFIVHSFQHILQGLLVGKAYNTQTRERPHRGIYRVVI